jgi:hypothetical protein
MAAHALKETKAGQDVTIVSKGIRHHTYSEGTYIDENEVGRTSFLQVTKIGLKYLYGTHFHIEDGKRELFHWEDKVNVDENLVLPGIRHDLAEAYNKKRLERAAFEKEREKAFYEIESEMRQIMRSKQDEWDKAHPRPRPINLQEIALREIALRINAESKTSLAS